MPPTKTTEAPEYNNIIDTQTHAFIKRTEDAFPADALRVDINKQRALYDGMCAVFHQKHPPGVTCQNCSIKGTDSQQIALRKYSLTSNPAPATKALIIYLHGGGFVVGSLDSHDDICAEICAMTGYSVTSVDYRLSPEYKHPAALNDVIDVIDNLSNSNEQPVVLCGDSAGANLAAAACHLLRNRARTNLNQQQPAPAVLGQVLIYPGLGGDMNKGSYLTHANAPMLTTQDVRFYAEVRCSPSTNKDDPSFAPLSDTDFSDLPPTVIFSAECDPLCDDGRDYYQRFQQSNTKAYWFLEQGLVHGYLRARHSVDRARDSFARIVDAINMLAENRWTYN